MSFFRSALAVLMAAFLSIGLAKAEVTDVTDESQLAPDRVVLDFAGRVRCSAADDFGHWGIGIGSDGGFTPVVDQIIVFGFVSSFLRNGTCTETPAGGDPSPLLIFDFEYPVTEAAFTLGNGGPGVTAELKAYDSAAQPRDYWGLSSHLKSMPLRESSSASERSVVRPFPRSRSATAHHHSRSR